MLLKNVLVAAIAALALTAGGISLAAQPNTPFVSGDEPMNVGQSAQIQAPAPNSQAQQKTQAMLNQEQSQISGDYPSDIGDQAQIKNPTPNLKEQKATARELRKVNNESGAISGKYD